MIEGEYPVLVIFEVYLEFEPHVADFPLMVPSKIDPAKINREKEKLVQENLQAVEWNYFSMIISIEVVRMKNYKNKRNGDENLPIRIYIDVS